MKEEIGFLKEELKNVQQKYGTMLTVRSGIQMSISRSKKYFYQMYGEKVEEAEELRLDLQDVKEMYKMQIDQLTNSKPL